MARAVPEGEDIFKVLENVIFKRLLPSLNFQSDFNDINRDVMALPNASVAWALLTAHTGP